MIRTARDDENDQGAAMPQRGLAEWLLAWWRIPLQEKFLRIGRSHEERRMHLVEVLALGGKRQLMLVLCDGKRYLVGAGADGIQSIVGVSDGPAVCVEPLPGRDRPAGAGALPDGLQVVTPNPRTQIECVL